jgi:signal peptidase I
VSPPPVDWTTRPIGETDDDGTDGDEKKEGPKRSLLHPSRILRDIIIPLAIAFSIAFLAQATLAKPYQIPSGSMEPTIQINDRILANRFIYHFKSIERGDIIVFEPPQVEGVDKDTPYVKRVIGLPGDEVEVREGITYVNGEEFVVDQVTEPPLYQRNPETVPEGMLFVLGDNRNSSLDSHVWGFLPVDNVIGRAEVIYWPLGNLERLD